jgi:hypothetical protein
MWCWLRRTLASRVGGLRDEIGRGEHTLHLVLTTPAPSHSIRAPGFWRLRGWRTWQRRSAGAARAARAGATVCSGCCGGALDAVGAAVDELGAGKAESSGGGRWEGGCGYIRPAKKCALASSPTHETKGPLRARSSIANER